MTDKRPVLGSISLSSIIVIVVLCHYLYGRHRLAGLQVSISAGTTTSHPNSKQSGSSSISIDKALLMRFTLAFVLLSAFQATLICFEFTGKSHVQALAEQTKPDYSVYGAVGDILRFIPGVTTSLMISLVFGTTAQFRQRYAEIFKSLQCWRRRSWVGMPAESLETWEPLGSGMQEDTQRYQLRAGRVMSIELGGFDGVKRSEPLVNVVEAKDSTIQRRSPVPQPWRALGLPVP